jgi:hypothetical protein
VGGPREVATQRCDSATPSFIPPLNNKRRAARKPPSALQRSQAKKAAGAAPTACGSRGPSWPGKSNLGRRSPSALRSTEKISSPAGNNSPPVGVSRSGAKLVNNRRGLFAPSSRHASGGSDVRIRGYAPRLSRRLRRGRACQRQRAGRRFCASARGDRHKRRRGAFAGERRRSDGVLGRARFSARSLRL